MRNAGNVEVNEPRVVQSMSILNNEQKLNFTVKITYKIVQKTQFIDT